jgi:branched-subunit amino acid aminotransferase/4-amino-4-deoxychorismate lyase
MRPHIYINGQIIPENKAAISPLNPGFLFGEGLFETIRADAGTIFMLPEHLARLRAGLKTLDLQLPPDFDQITTVTSELLARNRLLDKTAAIKLICSTKSPGDRTTPIEPSTSLIIRAAELDLDAISKRRQGMRALLLPWRRDRRNPLHSIKSLNYLENRYGLNEAKKAGFDEGIFLNQEEELCEGTFSNLFLIRQKTLLTPPLTAGILPGTCRAFILEKARQAGIDCQEIPLSAVELKDCDGALLTSSLMRMAPLTGVDRISFDLKQSTGLRRQLLDFFK